MVTFGRLAKGSREAASEGTTVLHIRCCSLSNISIHLSTFRASHRRCSLERGVLESFAKFPGKDLCQSLFFNKFAGLKPATLLKKRIWQRCFPMKFAKFSRTTS